jgi:fumarate reductase subunit C
VSSNVLEAKLWAWQRISATVLAVCVVVHLGVIIYAVRSGLGAAHILQRTHGNWLFGMLYSVFVVACAVHAPIGVANVADEVIGWPRRNSLWLAKVFGLVILVLGLRAVYGVTLA